MRREERPYVGRGGREEEVAENTPKAKQMARGVESEVGVVQWHQPDAAHSMAFPARKAKEARHTRRPVGARTRRTPHRRRTSTTRNAPCTRADSPRDRLLGFSVLWVLAARDAKRRGGVATCVAGGSKCRNGSVQTRISGVFMPGGRNGGLIGFLNGRAAQRRLRRELVHSHPRQYTFVDWLPVGSNSNKTAHSSVLLI